MNSLKMSWKYSNRIKCSFSSFENNFAHQHTTIDHEDYSQDNRNSLNRRNDRKKLREKKTGFDIHQIDCYYSGCIVYGTLWGFQFSFVYFFVVVKGSNKQNPVYFVARAFQLLSILISLDIFYLILLYLVWTLYSLIVIYVFIFHQRIVIT